MADGAEVEMMHVPHVRNTWTLGTVLSSGFSAMSLLSMLISVVWFAARVDTITKSMPDVIKQETQQAQAIAVLQEQQHYTDSRYAEILLQLDKIQERLDRQNERSPQR